MRNSLPEDVGSGFPGIPRDSLEFPGIGIGVRSLGFPSLLAKLSQEIPSRPP